MEELRNEDECMMYKINIEPGEKRWDQTKVRAPTKLSPHKVTTT